MFTHIVLSPTQEFFFCRLVPQKERLLRITMDNKEIINGIV